MRRLLYPALTVVAWTIAAPLTHAQVERFPCDQVSAQAPNLTEMGRFIDRQVERLSDADQRADANQSLLSPFIDCTSGVGVQFRLRYGEMLAARNRLGGFIEGDDPQLASIAAYIAGEAATGSTNQILRKGLESKSAEVRATAAVGARRSLQHFKGGRAGFQLAQATELVRHVSAALETEADPLVAQRHLAALSVACNAPGQPALAGGSVRAMSLSFARWVKTQRPMLGQRKPGAPDSAATIAAGVEAVSQAFLQQDAAQTINSAGAWNDIAVALSQVLAYARDRQIARDPIAEGDQKRMVDALNRTATLIAEIERNVRGVSSGRTPPALGDILANDLSGEQPGAFANAVEVWIGPNGHFTQAPYSIPARDLEPMVEPAAEPADAPDPDADADGE